MIRFKFDSPRLFSTSWFITNFVLAAIIYLNALLGAQLGIHNPSLDISVVWPATGFALAAVLLFGKSVCSGILLGNFLYNVTSLLKNGYSTPGALTLGFFVALCSLFQALFAYEVIRRYSSGELFSRLKDILIFLIPAGLFSSFLSSFFGMLFLSLYGGISKGYFVHTWMTFWLGDLMGLYIFTPAIYIWVKKKSPSYEIKKLREIPLMVAAFAIIWTATFVYNYPALHLFIPFCVWVTYRFLMHGATLALFCVSLATIAATSQNLGPFLNIPQSDPLLLLVSFLEVVIGMCLILATIFEERAHSQIAIERQNTQLKQELSLQKSEIKGIYEEMFNKETSAALGALYFEVTKQIIPSLKEVSGLTQKGAYITQNIAKQLEKQDHMDPEFLQGQINILQGCFKNIETTKLQVERLTELIEEQMFNTQKEIKSVNLHTLINQCLEKIVEDMTSRFPSFKFAVQKNYDREVTTVLALPWELSFAFMHLIYRALYSMKEQWNTSQGSYFPTLEIGTVTHDEHFEIVIRGFDSVGKHPLEMQSFFDIGTLPNITAIGLTLAHDIIVKIHHGLIHTDVKDPGVSLHILLPKSHETTRQIQTK